MEFKHRQPFTFEQVSQLDVAFLAEETSRLQNSLRRLKLTQDELQLLVDMTSNPDPEFMTAIQENKDVIDSLEERVTILKFVLAQKGVLYNSHYDPVPPEPQPTSPRPSTEPTIDQPDEGEGVHL